MPYDLFDSILQKTKNNEKLSSYEFGYLCVDKYLQKTISRGMLDDFIMVGMNGRIGDDDQLGTSNVSVNLGYIYLCHLLHPELNVDQIFEETLLKMLREQDFYDFYAALDAVYYQAQHELSHTASFTLDNPEVFEELKTAIKDREEHLIGNRIYCGRLYSDGVIGYVRKISSFIEETKGYRIY